MYIFYKSHLQNNVEGYITCTSVWDFIYQISLAYLP